MTEENTGVTAETPPEGGDKGSDNGSVESRARRMGWKPEGEWHGEPPKDGFRTAEEFVERGEAELPILRERNRKLDDELAQTNVRLDEMTGTLTEFRDYHAKTEERALARAKKELVEKQRQAVAAEDTAAFDKATKEIDALDADAAKARDDAARKPTAKASGDDPVFRAWSGENTWYGDDMELTAYADTIAPHVAKKTQATGRPYFDAISAEVKKRFADRFENPNRKAAPNVEGGGRMPGGGGKKGKGYSDLPAEAKAACDRYVKQELLTKEQYLADFDWSEA